MLEVGGSIPSPPTTKQYLHWQAVQGRQASPAAPRTTVSIQIDFARPLLPVAVLATLIASMALVRRLARRRVQRRLCRGIQAAGALLAMLQLGLLLVLAPGPGAGRSYSRAAS